MEKQLAANIPSRNKRSYGPWLILGGLLGTLLLSGVLLFTYAESPSARLVGTWQEYSWEYEKVNKQASESENLRYISEEVKELIGQKLSIHRAETWNFEPNGVLLLKHAGGLKRIHWKLNGRGQVLELKDQDSQENYNITELNDSTLVINFDTDMEVRGIARLTFVKNNKQHDLPIQ